MTTFFNDDLAPADAEEQAEAIAHDALVYELSVVLMRLDGNEGDPHHLIWCGGPTPEPWGDAWQKYEEQAEDVISAIGEGSAQAMVTAFGERAALASHAAAQAGVTSRPKVLHRMQYRFRPADRHYATDDFDLYDEDDTAYADCIPVVLVREDEFVRAFSTAKSGGGVTHIYAGNCPDENQPDARDPECTACRASQTALSEMADARIAGAALPADADAWARGEWPEHQLRDNGADTPLMVLVRRVWDAALAAGVSASPKSQQENGNA